jgi:hypothetical protein
MTQLAKDELSLPKDAIVGVEGIARAMTELTGRRFNKQRALYCIYRSRIPARKLGVHWVALRHELAEAAKRLTE